MLKSVVTQNVKPVITPNTLQHQLANRSSHQGSGLKKLIPQFGKRRRRTSAMMFGLAVSMGISSFPSKYLDSAAMATESEVDSSQPIEPSGSLTADRSTPATIDRSVKQLHSDFFDISVMRSHQYQQSQILLAQDISPSFHSSPVIDPTSMRNWRSSGEATIPIDVPSPRSQQFKIAPNVQAYFNPDVAGSEGELSQPGHPVPSHRTGETNISFTWPAAGTLTSRFGRRWGRMHQGIDIAGPAGTPIQAAADGTIVRAGWHSGGYGNFIEIKHSDGTITRYGHNSSLLVSVGQVVRQGQQIAAMGSTGRSTGSHLHFEIRPSSGNAINPVALLPSNN